MPSERHFRCHRDKALPPRQCLAAPAHWLHSAARAQPRLSRRGCTPPQRATKAGSQAWPLGVTARPRAARPARLDFLALCRPRRAGWARPGLRAGFAVSALQTLSVTRRSSKRSLSALGPRSRGPRVPRRQDDAQHRGPNGYRETIRTNLRGRTFLFLGS